MSQGFDATVKRQIKRYYDQSATTYDEEELNDRRPENDYVLDYHLKKYLPKSLNALILDAGGGTGRLAFPLAQQGHHIVLADLSRGMLLKAREKSRKSGRDGVLSLQSDLERLPFRSEVFDSIICFGDVLSYCNTESALADLTRVLKSGGTILLGVDNRYALAAELLARESNIEEAEKVIRTGTCRYPKEWGGHHVRAFLPGELRQVLSSNRIEVIDLVSRPYLTKSLSKDQRDSIYHDPVKTKVLCELELMASKEPTLLGASSVLFAIGAKRASGFAGDTVNTRVGPSLF